MRLVTWNVNSIRVRIDAVAAWTAKHRPDVLCLQEIKAAEDIFPLARFADLGYSVVLAGQPTYNGVAIATLGEAEDVVAGFADGGDDDPQRRLVRATFRGVRIVNCYCPNGEAPGTDKYAYKLRWYERLRAVLAAQEGRKRRLAVVGDFNVAPEAIDVHDPKRWEGKIHFSLPEREALAQMVADLRLVDCLRKHHAEAGIHTWWDYRLNAFARGWGLRIDHVLASPTLASACTDCFVDVEPRRGERPSDHAPVVADFSGI